MHEVKNEKEIPRVRGFRPRHALGQNFLYDRAILDRIVAASETAPGDRVLEIGAGAGTLTRALCRAGARVTALEVDRALEPVLSETLRAAGEVTLIFEDFLRTDLNKLHRAHLGGGPFRVVSNLPYYITTPIIMKLLESGLPVISLTLMVQKEVAERICAQPGGRDYGVLSVMAQFYTLPLLAATVPALAFEPPPRVDSAIVHMASRERPPVDVSSVDAFRRVVRAAFSQRRKQMVNSLASGLGVTREQARRLLEESDINPGARAETLTLAQFAALTRAASALPG
ncbi:MAG: 16S rRNA (adenine(1518)-N(6)/adenine(1519)-N(6))-dimethyltransferase RsmA [Clostridiales bacterium]|nr:16S rRNA (adenine(1518)-N(6)/adenine(1519)-N(6))-dimethyltransferase RsmA [Clostridiales bacterium]